MKFFVQYFKWTPLFCGLVWLIGRVIVGRTAGYSEGMTYGALSNIFLILMLVFLALVFKYRDRTTRDSFFEDVKDAMKPAMLYVLTAVLMMAVYYTVLSNEISILRAEKIDELNRLLSSPEEVATLKERYPHLRDMKGEEMYQESMANIDRNLSVSSILVGGGLALTMVSLGYALLAVFFWRTFVKRA
jgi:hypothetical protein